MVRADGDRREAMMLGKRMSEVLAFVAIALSKNDGGYEAYFGELERIGFPRSIPMLPHERSKYRRLGAHTNDSRVKALLLD